MKEPGCHFLPSSSCAELGSVRTANSRLIRRGADRVTLPVTLGGLRRQRALTGSGTAGVPLQIHPAPGLCGTPLLRVPPLLLCIS